MYCKDCGKEIDGDSKFCSFCGAKQSASFVPPHTGTPVQPKEPIAVNRPETQTVISKYDQTYKKETDATFIGVILFISWMIFIGANTKFEDKALFFAVWLCVLIMRIILTVWVVGIAKRQNRNTTSWGLLAFFFPSVTLIIIGQINKLRLIVTIDSSLPLKQQISTLIEKANEFSSSERYYECIEILNKVIEFESENKDAIYLRGFIFYKLGEYTKSKKDFEALQTMDEFPKLYNYYLGMFELKNYNYEKAIELWKLAKENGNEEANSLLNKYQKYKGNYFLNSQQLSEKLGSMSYFGAGEYISGISEIEKIEDIKKFQTVFGASKYGIAIELTKKRKEYNIGISFTEILDIKYNKEQKLFSLYLFDNSIVSFTNDYDIKRFCEKFKEETGIQPTATTKKY